MPLQDLTPQLRTRLSRMEWAVGWFVLLATLLLALGFGYYVYSTAKSKGWFKIKAPYFTYVDSADGLHVGDPVKMMGFQVGQITRIEAEKPWAPYNVYIQFEILQPYYGYIWTVGSRVKVASADLLGKRELAVTKGTGGYYTYSLHPSQLMPVADIAGLPDLNKWRLAEEIYGPDGTNVELKANQPLTAELVRKITDLKTGRDTNTVWILDANEKGKAVRSVWSDKGHYFQPYGRTNLYWLQPDETPALTEQAQALLTQVEVALPNILGLTNDIMRVLSNSASLTSNLNAVAANARPAVSNLAAISANLRNPQGSLGEWLIPTNLNQHLAGTLQNADVTMTNVNTNLVILADEVSRSLDNLANLTSNLNAQVQANSNMLSQISSIVVHSDEFVQGLKHHWLLRSAFRTPKTNAPPAFSPREKGGH